MKKPAKREWLIIEHARYAVLLTAGGQDGRSRIIGTYKTQREAIEAHNERVARGAHPDPRYIPESP